MRVLLLADTHLGFDSPQRPRVQRRRRGPDFFASFERALRPALEGRVDLVVHGGDLLYRARVPPGLVQRAMAPLFRVADRGVPVVLVPGNHERSRIPFPLLAAHPRVHVFFEPHTFLLDCGGLRIAVSGFPFAKRKTDRIERTGWRTQEADIRLLCMHQAVEGARVGVHDYTFRAARDVFGHDDIPAGFAAVMSGHIHRWQVLDEGFAAPVLYPGSIERTSFAERGEEKGYLLVDVVPNRLAGWRFVPLPTRPMVQIEADNPRELRRRLARLDPHSVVRVSLRGDHALSAARLRALAPPTMNVTLKVPRRPDAAGRP